MCFTCFRGKIPCCVACRPLCMGPELWRGLRICTAPCPVCAAALCLLAEPPSLSAWMLGGFRVLNRSVVHPPPEPQCRRTPEPEVLPADRLSPPSGPCVQSADGGRQDEVLVETQSLPHCDQWPGRVLATLLPSLWP